MKYTELKSDIEENGARAIYLFEGDDAYFRINGAKLILNKFLRFPELNYTAFDGENLKGEAYADFVSAIKNYPFMSEKRIIKVSELYPSESEYQKYLEPLFSDFPSAAILIITNSGAKKGVDLKRKKGVAYFDCNRADRDSVTKWVYVTLKRAGVVAGVKVCEAVADYCLLDMARVSVETQKLIDYKVKGELTFEEADALIYKDAEYRIYEMTNAVSNRNFGAFCTVADDLKRKGYDEIAILNSLFSYFRNLLTVFSSRASDSETAKLLKMKEYGVKRSREQAAAIGEDRLVALTDYLYTRISEIKSGKITPQSALQTVQNAIFFATD